MKVVCVLDFLLWLQTETLDELYEWKASLETAVAQAPSASAIGLGRNGMLNTEQDEHEASNDPAEQRYGLLLCYVGLVFLTLFYG